MNKHRLVLQVTYEALLEAIGLFPPVRLFSIVQEPEDVMTGSVRLVIEHPVFPEVYEDEIPRTVTIEQCIKLLEERG